MNRISANDVYNIVGMAREGESLRNICHVTGVSTNVVGAYRRVLFAYEGEPLCGCGASSLHMGPCLWRKNRKKYPGLVKVRKIRASTSKSGNYIPIPRRQNKTGDQEIVDRCESAVLRAIHKSTGHSAYYIPI